MKNNSFVVTTTYIFGLDTHTMEIRKKKKKKFIVIIIENIG